MKLLPSLLLICVCQFFMVKFRDNHGFIGLLMCSIIVCCLTIKWYTLRVARIKSSEWQFAFCSSAFMFTWLISDNLLFLTVAIGTAVLTYGMSEPIKGSAVVTEEVMDKS